MIRKITSICLVLFIATVGSAWSQHGFKWMPAIPRLGFDNQEGLLINRVLPDSPAEEAGLLRGDIL